MLALSSCLTTHACRGVLMKAECISSQWKTPRARPRKGGRHHLWDPEGCRDRFTIRPPEDDILARAAAINSHFLQPIAITEAAWTEGIEIPPLENYVSITGRGAAATIAGHLHFIGNQQSKNETCLCGAEIEGIPFLH